ncbi:MAG: 3-phosphoshikimate 1-carboxyvinyltransferase [Nitrososphaerota archaeon]
MTDIIVYPSGVKGEIKAPPSKSFTHRAIIISSLANGISRIRNPLISLDTLATIKACESFGIEMKMNKEEIKINGSEILKTPENIIDVANSGTTIRIMTAVSSLVPKGYVILTGDSSIRKRPMEPLLKSLRKLGVKCWSTRENGLPPIIVKGGTLKGGETKIRGDISSQFISALLITAPKAKKKTIINIIGKIVSKPYIDSTIYMLKLSNIKLNILNDYRKFSIPSKQSFSPIDFTIPGDFSSASFLIASAILSNGNIKIKNLDTSIPQADSAIIDILSKMGVEIEINKEKKEIFIQSPKKLLGGTFNLMNSPDLIPIISILALKAENPTKIIGVKHARYKETDRIYVLSKELRKIGAKVIELEDGLIIKPIKKIKPAKLNSHGDHRIFMALSLIGLICEEGCRVSGLETASISYPNFINDLKNISIRLEVLK